MSEDIEHCERCNKPFDDDLIDFYEDEEGGGIWCCEDCLDAEIDTPMGRNDRPYPPGIAFDEAWRQRQRANAAFSDNC